MTTDNKENREKTKVIKTARPLREDEVRKEFRNYFVKIKRQLKLDPSLEGVIWLHFKAAGFDQPEKFDKGIENFGYKL